MDMSGWNMNWQGFSQNPTVYQNSTVHPDAPGYPNGDPSLTDAAEDEQMGGMADSLATLRPEPEPDEQNMTLESTIPGHMPYDGVQYPTTESSQLPSQPSGTTSQTSLDDLFHDYDIESDQIAQQRFNAHDLVHVAGWNQTAPTIADHIDLGEATGAQATQPLAVKIDHLHPSQAIHPEMMGLSDRGNEPVTLPPQNLQDHLTHVNTHYRKLFAPGEAVLALEDLVQTQQSLSHLMSNVDALIKTRESMAPKNPSISTPSSVDRGPQMFRCIQCLQEGKPAGIFYNVGSFKRHVNEQHYPQFEYHCPLDRCHEIKFRRSKMKDHLTNTHQQIPRPRTIEDNTHERPVEPVCKFCSQTMRSWKEFYNCFMGHCVISSPSQSRRSSDDRGSTMGASGSGNNTVSSLVQNHANPPPPPPAPPAPPAYSSYGHDDCHGQSTAFQGANSSQGYHLSVSAPMSRSVSDDVVRGPASTNASPSRLSRHSHLNRRVISGDPLSGILPGHRRSQLPRSALRNSARQSAGSSEPNCRGCGGPFDACTVCRLERSSGGRCCRCHSSSSALQVGQAGPAQGQIARYINPATGIPEPQLQAHPTQQGFPALPVYRAQQAPQPVPPRFNGNFGSQMARVMGIPSASPRGGQYDVLAVTQVAEPSFDELDMEYSMCESKIAQPIGSWLSTLPMRTPFVRSVIKPLKELSSSLYGGTCVASPGNLFPELVQNPTPPSRCNCPCRTAAKLQEAYFGRARAELSPGKQVKLDLKILSPENGGSGQHPPHLRTRVQLVVKLLKLRTSAARSPRKKQEKQAKHALEQALESTFERSGHNVAEETDDSDESDMDSIFDDDTASISSSCSDIDALAPATPVLPCLEDECPGSGQGYEETTALSFEFDLDSTLYALSRWSGGLSEDLCSDLTVMDPRSVLDYFFGYIMYVMVILSRSGEYGGGSRLNRGSH